MIPRRAAAAAAAALGNVPQLRSVLVLHAALSQRRLPSQPLASQRRLNSSKPSSSSSSDHSQFWKTFARPITKVLLVAVFTYQLAYFAWVKLEQEEIRTEREAEFSELEAKVKSLQAATTTTTKPS